MKKGSYIFTFISALIVLGMIMGCNASKSYRAKYEAAWDEIVQSDAWKSSLRNSADKELEATTDSDTWLAEEGFSGEIVDPFDNRYNSWISRAYFKIITEAEEADRRIKSEYDRFMAENPEADASTDENVRQILTLYKKKYLAHKDMLEGLKSWHAFEEYGSDDLEFFKAEYRSVIRAMHNSDHSEQEIINFLVYKLADLYHLDPIDE